MLQFITYYVNNSGKKNVKNTLFITLKDESLYFNNANIYYYYYFTCKEIKFLMYVQSPWKKSWVANDKVNIIFFLGGAKLHCHWHADIFSFFDEPHAYIFSLSIFQKKISSSSIYMILFYYGNIYMIW